MQPHVVNLAQLKEEVAKRDRPLFAGGKKSFEVLVEFGKCLKQRVFENI
jgi:hypothetical protein